MRSVLLIAALVCVASAAHAQDTRESRYGPRPSQRSGPLSAASGYSGPVLGWSGKQEPAQPTAIQAPPPAAIPQRIAAAPQAMPVAQTRPAFMPDPAPQRPAPPQLAAAAPYPPTAQALGPAMSRTYSVGRQYGMQPDAMAPLQPNGMVLIAPTDEPPPAKGEPPRHGSAEWLAGGVPSDKDDSDRDDAKDKPF